MEEMDDPNKIQEDDLKALAQAVGETKLSTFQSPTDYHVRCRVMPEPLIFDFLKKQQGPVLQNHWIQATIPAQSEKAIVIVERRCHANLAFCLWNAVWAYPGAAVHVFCSKTNEDWVRTIVSPHAKTVHIHVVFENQGTAEAGKQEQNELLKTRTFWESIESEKILLTETDAQFVDTIPASIEEYDQVGSKWPWLPQEPGGGGLTFRKRSAMLKICDNYATEQGVAQDAFAAMGCLICDLKWDREFKQFAEAAFDSVPVGWHQWWNFGNQVAEEDKVDFIRFTCTLRNCPLVIPLV